jgi:hypothetical protein
MEEKSIFEELAPYAKMVIVPGVTVGNLTYSNQQDLYSTSVFTSGATGIVAANTSVPFFQGALGESAISQGYAGGVLSISQTNSKFSKGQAPANQVYIATHCGFQLSQLWNTATTVGSTNLANAHQESLLIGAQETADNLNDAFSVAQNFSWNLTIGRGITRNIGTLSEYTAPGVFAALEDGFNANAAAPNANDGATAFAQLGDPWSQIRKLEVPVVFPPLVNVQIAATCGSPFQLQQIVTATAANNLGAGNINVQIRCMFRGYLMTMPVG